MLQQLLNLLINARIERADSQTTYCGWGTEIDEILNEMEEAGASRHLVQEMFALAEHLADAHIAAA
jgi:hypothetical protein